MRILYSAIDQPVPGSRGGSVHVRAVAEGLAARGHDVHVLASAGDGPFPAGPVRWHSLSPPLGLPQLRLARFRRVLAVARSLRPDVIMERYHNFGGEGMKAARSTGALGVLEVNAPVIDYPGSLKRRLDRALLVEPMRRWRDWQCDMADLIVTPSPAIVPSSVGPDRLLPLEWGADTARFRPGVTGPVPFRRQTGRIIAVFAGAFRRWHGAIHLVDAIRALRARGRHEIDGVFIGDGPELHPARAAAVGLSGITWTGAVPHDHMPAMLAAADIGVAPFDVAAHPPLTIDFYWSPLKILEYMSSGLPVLAPAIVRLHRLVRDGVEGLLYDASNPGALPDALERLLDPDLRRTLGAAARTRAVAEFGWDAHCAALEAAMSSRLRDRRPRAGARDRR